MVMLFMKMCLFWCR